MLLPYLNTLNEQKTIVLASGSAQRKRLLEQVGLNNFIVSPSGFAEDLPKSDFPDSIAYVVKTSEHKLLHKLEELKGNLPDGGLKADIVIVADSIASFEDREVIEKPRDEQHAFDMIKSHVQRGSHQIYTAVWIAFLDKDTQEVTKMQNFVEKTTLSFWQGITDETIWAYVRSGEPFGKAGGYGVQA